MSNSFKVKIGNFELALTGDRDRIIKSAKEVNEQLNYLSENSDIRGENLPVVAALNIAEKNIINDELHNSETKYILEEVKKMREYINENIK